MMSDVAKACTTCWSVSSRFFNARTNELASSLPPLPMARSSRSFEPMFLRASAIRSAVKDSLEEGATCSFVPRLGVRRMRSSAGDAASDASKRELRTYLPSAVLVRSFGLSELRDPAMLVR